MSDAGGIAAAAGGGCPALPILLVVHPTAAESRRRAVSPPRKHCTERGLSVATGLDGDRNINCEICHTRQQSLIPALLVPGKRYTWPSRVFKMAAGAGLDAYAISVSL